MIDDLASGALALPSELRALIDFLAVDRRPTAILYTPNETRQLEDEYKLVHCNPAFRSLPETHEKLDRLRRALAHAYRFEQDVHLHGEYIEGGRWQCRISGQYYILLEETPSGIVSSHTTDQLPQDYDDGDPLLDWTRSALPNMSPWIEFIRNWNWAETGLGPMESWSPVLRTSMRSMMANPNPRLIVWGDNFTFVYNEACAPIWGKLHPECLGQHVSKPFTDAWPHFKPILEEVKRGAVKTMEGYQVMMNRNGFLEETYWDFTLLPILGIYGEIVAMFDEITETTIAVTGERRRAVLRNLSKRVDTVSTLPELWPAVLETLNATPRDVAFAAIYTIQDANSTLDKPLGNGSSKKCVFAGAVGLPEDCPELLDDFRLDYKSSEPASGLLKHCIEAWQSRQVVLLRAQDESLPASLRRAALGRVFDATLEKAVVCPIRLTISSDVPAILLLGLSPYCDYSGEYELFVNLIMDFTEKTAALISLPEEQRRVKKVSDDIHNALAQQLELTTLKAERSEAKFTRLAATAPTGMFMFDADGKPLYVNDSYLDMLGVTKEEALAKRPEAPYWEDILHEDDLQPFIDSWTQITEGKTPSTLEYRLKKPWKSKDKFTGQEISGQTWLLATAFPEIDPDGRVSTVQGWLTDISHRKFTENLLAQRLEDALENKRQTENFIDMTSHEMRNPLSAILQSADSIVSALANAGSPLLSDNVLLNAETTEDITDAAQTIILCAQHQKRIVDDVLTLSKLDASLLVISPDKVQPPTLITKAFKMFEAEIERADIDVQLVVEPTYEELAVDWVVLDPSRLLQVIINLLTNSVKFTQYSATRKITVYLGASYQRPTGAHHGVQFIPMRHFRSRPPSLPQSADGEDIYIQIAVYDTGRGLTEEELAMLFRRFKQANPKTYGQYGGSGLGLFISQQLCELQGGQIGATSSGGKTCFTFFVEAKRWNPAGDTANLSPKRVPSFTSTAASPIAYGRRGSTVMDDQSSQDGSSTRDPSPLGTAQRTHTGPVATAHSPKMLPRIQEGVKGDGMHVLVVEDNLINQKVVSQQLRRAGCVVHVANHGVECLELLEKSVFCSAKMPLSVVLLDLEMPIMDGLTCVRHIRERQSSGKIVRHVPVIAVTANARSEQINTAIEAGMDQVVTKPFRIPELIPQMEKLIAEVVGFQTISTNGT